MGGSNIIIHTPLGRAAMNGLQFDYIERWSSSTTWGGLPPPADGESVWIPAGMKVLLDVPTAKLDLVVIVGLLMFENVEDIELKMQVR